MHLLSRSCRLMVTMLLSFQQNYFTHQLICVQKADHPSCIHWPERRVLSRHRVLHIVTYLSFVTYSKIQFLSLFSANFFFLSPSCFSLFIIFCHKMRTAAPQVKTVCHILMFITACDIYIKSENECRLYILLYYELKFNRNNLFMFKYIFSIKNLKHK